MSILFSDIYRKAIHLFDDPKITRAYETNQLQFNKLMYGYLQNAISMFDNPLSVSIRLSAYKEPEGVMQIFEGDGVNRVFALDSDFIIKDNSTYNYVEGDLMVEGTIDASARTVTFPDILPVGQQYAVEQYYCGEFTDSFIGLSKNSTGTAHIIGYVKDILARLLVKAWGEEERNMLLDIRNIMQDSDFKLTSNDKILKAKDEWVRLLDDEISQYKNRLAWQIRFMYGSNNIGRG